MKLILFLLLLTSEIALPQSDSISLNREVGKLTEEKWTFLKEKTSVSDFDIFLLKTYVSELKNKGNNINNYSYLQLLDTLQVIKNSMKNGVLKIDKKKKDSIFIRNPSNEKKFLGLADMSIEKLVSREKRNLPNQYDEKLDITFSSPIEVSKVLQDLNLDSTKMIIFGNVLLIQIEQGRKISNIKIGEILEITNRILQSKEFKSIEKLIPKD